MRCWLDSFEARTIRIMDGMDADECLVKSKGPSRG